MASSSLTVKYAVVIERGPRSYGATVPDLPGCFAVAKTLAGVKQLMRGAIAMHIDGLRDDGLPVPQPRTQVAMIGAKRIE